MQMDASRGRLLRRSAPPERVRHTTGAMRHMNVNTYDETSQEYAAQVGDYWGQRETNIRSWWQSPIVLEELRRRVTGDPAQSFEAYFRERYCPTPFGRALSLGAGGGHFERALLDLDVCDEILGVDISPARVGHANALVPEHMQ